MPKKSAAKMQVLSETGVTVVEKEFMYDEPIPTYPNLGKLAAVDPNQIHEIPLDQIRPAPWNPPGRMDPKTVEELADSINTQGQQIPALVRPVDADAPIRFEMVWGHRRWAGLLLLQEAWSSPAVLRTFIRPMSEEEAMILSGIENLQRQGFSDIEEAEFFRAAGERYGESAVKMLAEKLSVSERYIRKRVEILKLPEPALKLWREGTWHVGHMEQLLRLQDDEKVESFLKEQDRNVRKELGVWQLKGLIDQRAVELSAGRFDKAECKLCRKNTECQLRLFGGEKEKGAKCLDAKCFIRKQQAWHDINWTTCKTNKYGTQKAHITDAYDRGTGVFGEYGNLKVPDRCTSCEKFTTVIRVTGQIWQEKTCFGDPDCFNRACKEMNRAAKKGLCDLSGSGEGGPDPDAPRVEWHGEYFRQQFYADQVPQLLEGLLTEDPRRLQLALAFIIHGSAHLHGWLCEKLGVTPPKPRFAGADPHLQLWQILKFVRPQKPVFIEYLAAEACIKAAFPEHTTPSRYVNLTITFSDPDRQAIAEFLDVDFSEWAPSDEWFDKKTRAELVKYIVHESRLTNEDTFLNYASSRGVKIQTSKIAESLANAKKPDLVDLIQNCGVDLHGRLPKEIADRPKLGGNNA
jgi:ParB/RepB/Spo0J family partition protein